MLLARSALGKIILVGRDRPCKIVEESAMIVENPGTQCKSTLTLGMVCVNRSYYPQTLRLHGAATGPCHQSTILGACPKCASPLLQQLMLAVVAKDQSTSGKLPERQTGGTEEATKVSSGVDLAPVLKKEEDPAQGGVTVQ